MRYSHPSPLRRRRALFFRSSPPAASLRYPRFSASDPRGHHITTALPTSLPRGEAAGAPARGRKRALGVLAPLELPSGPNERWSLHFVSDCFTDVRRFRILAIVDDFKMSLSTRRLRLPLLGALARSAREEFMFLQRHGGDLGRGDCDDHSHRWRYSSDGRASATDSWGLTARRRHSPNVGEKREAGYAAAARLKEFIETTARG